MSASNQRLSEECNEEQRRYTALSGVVLNQPAQARLIAILGLIMIMYIVSTPSPEELRFPAERLMIKSKGSRPDPATGLFRRGIR